MSLQKNMKNATKTYRELKQEHSDNVNNLIMRENKVFWAFSREQLEEGKREIGVTENKDLISIGMGGFLPKKNAQKFFKEMDVETKRFNKELREARKAKEEAILYELNNHEAFYTGSIEEVVEIFKGIYTTAEIRKVFKKFNK
jgi:glutamate synthase domain-containing protein 1